MEKRCPAYFGIIALVLLCAGAFSPGWFVYDTDKFRGIERSYPPYGIKVHMGLFYVVAVGEDFRKIAGYGDFHESSILKISLLEYLIEVIIGIVLCLISVILTFTYKKEGTNGVLVGIIIMYIIAGTATFLAVGRWFNGVIFMSHDSGIHMSVPYSLILSCLGAIFSGITMICVSRMHCQLKADRQVKVSQVYFGVVMTEYPQT
ncbi:Hypothetical predicted protein [Mytilus galloprovincialis]|uniref:Uncharacterized protein n=1 Tax=Mytilus galloprovincialis TaxID=29158 RepID=A0A8B6C3C1_MYTGA|nr:Hypothetical predicted protein [Mytilus galloprovincialis]